MHAGAPWKTVPRPVNLPPHTKTFVRQVCSKISVPLSTVVQDLMKLAVEDVGMIGSTYSMMHACFRHAYIAFTIYNNPALLPL